MTSRVGWLGVVIVVAGCGGSAPPAATPEPPVPGAVQWTEAEGGNGHWYAVVGAAGGITWSDADAEARRLGGHLATLGSAAENEFVYRVVAGARDAWAVNEAGALLGPWLGGYQEPGSEEPGGGWRWVSDEPWSFEHWRTDRDPQPNDAEGIEDRLVYMNYDERGPVWNDYPASPDGSTWHQPIRGFVLELE